MRRRIILAAIAAVALAVIGLRLLPDDGNRDTSGSGAALADVTVPPLTGAALEGKAVFDAHCAACHGENAAGRDGAGPPLVHTIYRPAHHADASFILAARNGVIAHHWSFGNMPPVPQVNDEEVARVIAYVRRLQEANGIH
ncbi:MAG: cytochrome C [Phyllobacteriaceae bacterium]|nr:cytochrome C [Phyllobacteriaceae bacterium]MBA91552.1 cytochrome C [Phyllobacteriaceae bacterium]